MSERERSDVPLEVAEEESLDSPMEVLEEEPLPEKIDEAIALAEVDYSHQLTDVDTQPLPIVPPSQGAEVVVAGHICLDIIPTLRGNSVVLAPGRLIEAGKALLATGGPVSNTGLALHKLGVKTRLMGKVGDDMFGQMVFQILESYGAGLAGGMIIAPGEETSYSVIFSPPGTDRVILHSPGCNDTFGPEDIRYDLLENSGLFHFGYPPLMARMYRDNGEELVSIFRRVKECGVTTSLDLSMPDPSTPSGRADWRSILSAVLPYVDVFLPSIEELLLMLRKPTFDKLSSKAGKVSVVEFIPPEVFSDMAKMLLDMGTRIVGLKAGPRGLYLATGGVEALAQLGRAQPMKLAPWANRELWAPCFETQVVGTTGSGDATIAGFLMGLLRGMNPAAALSAACAVGASNVEAADALSGIHSWPETMERIAAGWPRLRLTKKGRNALDMASFDWRWDETNEVWVGPMDIHY